MQLWELDEGQEFTFQCDKGTTYRVERLIVDNKSCVTSVIVRSVARKLDGLNWTIIQGMEESANHCASVETLSSND